MKLSIGDGRAWSFVHGAWKEAGGILEPQDKPDENGGEGMQGYRFAFLKDSAYADLKARFEMQHVAGHSDAGLIFRAKNKREFFVLHFPCCGQAYRAQHFWAALSKMDASGYLRIEKLRTVSRVASNAKIWHAVEADVHGQTITVRIDGTGVFECSGLDDGAGAVGMFMFGQAAIRDVTVDGKPDSTFAWDDRGEQPTNWFFPCENTQHGEWQMPQTLVRAPNGELVLWFGVMEGAFKGKRSVLIIRSSDDGRTWGNPVPVPGSESDAWGLGGKLHLFPDGKLRFMSMQEGKYVIQEVSDDVSSFSDAVSQVGDSGIVDVGLGTNPGGAVAQLFGSTTFAMMSITDRDILLDLCERRTNVILNRLRFLLDEGVGPYFSMAGQEFVAPPLHGLKDFYDFNVKYDKPIIDMAHESGGRVHIHCHGSIKSVFQGFLDMGADVLHPFEPPPLGDITASEAKALARGKLCLEGNTQINRMYECSPEEIREETEALIRDAFNDHRGLIVCPTASPYIRGEGEACFPMYKAMIDTVVGWSE